MAGVLEERSRHGAAHHSALLPGDHAQAVAAFARLAGLVWVLL